MICFRERNKKSKDIVVPFKRNIRNHPFFFELWSSSIILCNILFFCRSSFPSWFPYWNPSHSHSFHLFSLYYRWSSTYSLSLSLSCDPIQLFGDDSNHLNFQIITVVIIVAFPALLCFLFSTLYTSHPLPFSPLQASLHSSSLPLQYQNENCNLVPLLYQKKNCSLQGRAPAFHIHSRNPWAFDKR